MITHHPITHFLSLKNPQISHEPSLAPKPGYVFKSKNSKMWDPHFDYADGVVVMEANAH